MSEATHVLASAIHQVSCESCASCRELVPQIHLLRYTERCIRRTLSILLRKSRIWGLRRSANAGLQATPCTGHGRHHCCRPPRSGTDQAACTRVGPDDVNDRAAVSRSGVCIDIWEHETNGACSRPVIRRNPAAPTEGGTRCAEHSMAILHLCLFAKTTDHCAKCDAVSLANAHGCD